MLLLEGTMKKHKILENTIICKKVLFSGRKLANVINCHSLRVAKIRLKNKKQDKN